MRMIIRTIKGMWLLFEGLKNRISKYSRLNMALSLTNKMNKMNTRCQMTIIRRLMISLQYYPLDLSQTLQSIHRGPQIMLWIVIQNDLRLLKTTSMMRTRLKQLNKSWKCLKNKRFKLKKNSNSWLERK